MTIETGGPAFPLTFIPENCSGVPSGMTLRDWFAGQYDPETIHLNDHSIAEAIVGPAPKDTSSVEYLEWAFLLLGKLSYMYADAKLKARGES